MEYEFYKFPSTPHIKFTSNNSIRKEKLVTNAELDFLLNNNVVVEEKIDGANLGISFDFTGNILLQNRGAYLSSPFKGQWSKLSSWLIMNEDNLLKILLDKYILFGEWCYAKHSIYYDQLPDWFIAFDIYDKENDYYLSTELRNKFIQDLNMFIPPKLHYGKIDIADLDQYIKQSKYGHEQSEGIYLRCDASDKLLVRAKYVKSNFIQETDEHWSKKKLISNKIIYRE